MSPRAIHFCFFNCFFIASGVFSQPAIQGAITGLSTSIPCELGRQVDAPFWFINGIVYELFSIPQYFPSIPEVNSYTSLSIPFVTFMIDNVIFRCATFERNGNLSSADNALRLVVQGDSFEIMERNTTTLVLDYQRLYIQLIDGVTIEWTFSNICNEEFELQGFLIANSQAVRSPDYDIVINSSNTAQIPSTQFLTETANIIYYRLVAVWPNRTVCSDRTSQDTYYGFEESAFLQAMYSTPSTPNICFELPSIETNCGAGLYFVWPQREEGLSCLCPVYNSDDGRSVFAACVRGCTNTDILPRLGEGEVCISKTNTSMSEALFHFMCSTDPCTGNCFAKRILSSYRVFFLEEERPLVGLFSRTGVLCDIQTGLGFPHWLVNGTLYTLPTLLQLYPLFSVDNSNNTLWIIVTADIHNTTFQCAALDENGLILGPLTRILIADIDGNDPVERGDDAAITFDYQDLVITNNSIRLGWTVGEQFFCRRHFEVQRISRVSSPDLTSAEAIVQTNSINAVISSSNSIYLLRIVAVFDNSSVCSNPTSEETLYYFGDSQELNTTYWEPNSTVCIDIPRPETTLCGDIVVAWGKNCTCPVDSEFFYRCGACSSSSVDPSLSENSQAICFTDLNFSLNGTLSHFLYTCGTCDGCDDKINTILSSHRIIISEPPTEPEVMYNTSLCFSTISSIMATIDYTISAMGNNSTPRQLSASQCIPDPFLDVCIEFNVTASARNAVGSSSSAENFTSNACRDPPSMPSITYNPNGSLCFSVKSFTDVTLNYTIFTIEKTCPAEELEPPKCIDDPFPNNCTNFSVTVSAMNKAGSSQNVEHFTSHACARSESKNNHLLPIILGVGFPALFFIALFIALVIYYCDLCPKRCYKSKDAKAI